MPNKKKQADNKRRYHERIAEAKKFLGNVCSNPECDSSYKLEFHHVNPEEKIHTVTYLAKYSKEKFWNEVEKCVLLCQYCHDDFHSDEIMEGERPYALTRRME